VATVPADGLHTAYTLVKVKLGCSRMVYGVILEKRGGDRAVVPVLADIEKRKQPSDPLVRLKDNDCDDDGQLAGSMRQARTALDELISPRPTGRWTSQPEPLWLCLTIVSALGYVAILAVILWAVSRTTKPFVVPLAGSVPMIGFFSGATLVLAVVGSLRGRQRQRKTSSFRSEDFCLVFSFGKKFPSNLEGDSLDLGLFCAGAIAFGREQQAQNAFIQPWQRRLLDRHDTERLLISVSMAKEDRTWVLKPVGGIHDKVWEMRRACPAASLTHGIFHLANRQEVSDVWFEGDKDSILELKRHASGCHTARDGQFTFVFCPNDLTKFLNFLAKPVGRFWAAGRGLSLAAGLAGLILSVVLAPARPQLIVDNCKPAFDRSTGAYRVTLFDNQGAMCDVKVTSVGFLRQVEWRFEPPLDEQNNPLASASASDQAILPGRPLRSSTNVVRVKLPSGHVRSKGKWLRATVAATNRAGMADEVGVWFVVR